MRTADFIVASDISREVCREGGRAFRAAVMRDLKAILDEPLPGPRGGQYRRSGPVRWEMFPAEMRPGYVIAARCMGRYVRPKR